MRLLDDYREAMDVQTRTEARMWMAARVREFLDHWQHDAVGWEQARAIICIQLAYAAGMRGAADQERVYQLYGAIHPSLLAMSKHEKKGRMYPHEFTPAELSQGAARWLPAAAQAHEQRPEQEGLRI